MTTLFSICAIIGCTILLLQTALQIFGLASDLPGGEVGGHHHLPPYAGNGHVHDVSAPTHDHAGNIGTGVSGDHHLPDPADADVISKIVRFISIQTIVSFLAFFGLAGLAALQAGASQAQAGLAGLAAGGISVFVIGRILRLYRSLERDGTVRIARTVGCDGRVYLAIPGFGGGEGKVTLRVQGRTIEIRARTSGPTLPTGSSVVVSRALDHKTVEVVAAESPAHAPVSNVN